MSLMRRGEQTLQVRDKCGLLYVLHRVGHNTGYCLQTLAELLPYLRKVIRLW